MIVGCSDPTKTIENNISNGNNNSENDIIWKDVSANLPPSGNSNIPIYNLKYLNSTFFVCNMHYIHSSSDLIKWTGKDFNKVNYNVGDILSIGYGNDRYIVTGRGKSGVPDGKLFYSDDGFTWINISFPNIYSFNDVYFAKNKFIITGGTNTIEYSEDGINWTKVNPSFDQANYFSYTSITYGVDKFVVLGHTFFSNVWEDGGERNKILYSLNGLEWNEVQNTTFGDSYIYFISYCNNKFIAGGADGKIAYSNDGITWITLPDIGFGTNTINGIAYGDNKYVAIGEAGKIIYSEDFVNWKTITNTPFGNRNIRYIVYGDNKFVVIDAQNKIAYWDVK
jgi:hypothetical protein